MGGSPAMATPPLKNLKAGQGHTLSPAFNLWNEMRNRPDPVTGMGAGKKEADAAKIQFHDTRGSGSHCQVWSYLKLLNLS
jgi:hypothetical protein